MSGDIPPPAGAPAADDDAVIATSRRWLEVAVIGLGLCPYACAVHRERRIRWQVSRAGDAEALRSDLGVELQRLADSDPTAIETTLLVHPQALLDFTSYNRFLGRADRAVARLGLRGVMQIASFHPHYRFAGCAADDAANYTNRSPYPMLQILRESSIERALCASADHPRAIYLRNIARLREMGHIGWTALWAADDGSTAVGPVR